jgi:hypothetical protein
MQTWEKLHAKNIIIVNALHKNLKKIGYYLGVKLSWLNPDINVCNYFNKVNQQPWPISCLHH